MTDDRLLQYCCYLDTTVSSRACQCGKLETTFPEGFPVLFPRGPSAVGYSTLETLAIVVVRLG